MIVYLSKRIFQFIPTLFGITVLSFLLMQLAPGGPVDQMADLNPRMSLEAKERIRAELGLDQPVSHQFLTWGKKVLKFDFGRSFVDKRPVMEKIGERLPATLLLNVLSIAVMLLLAIPIGFISAVRKGTRWDQGLTLLVFIGFSVPTYAVALWLMMFFGLQLGWLPISGLHSLWVGEVSGWTRFWDTASHLLLPTLVLGLTSLAGLSRLMRNTMLEVLHQDYIRAAFAKGLSPKRVYGVHALRNALLPIVTVIGLLIPDLIGGSIIIETIFAYPGLGRLAFEAIMTRDYNLIMALTVIGGVLTMLGNFVADLLYAVADPRVRS